MSGAVGGFARNERPPRSELDLVQHGVPLSTVRDLLGHGSVGMSLRYALLRWSQDLSSILACAYMRNRKHLDFLIGNGEGRFSALTLRLRQVGS